MIIAVTVSIFLIMTELVLVAREILPARQT